MPDDGPLVLSNKSLAGHSFQAKWELVIKKKKITEPKSKVSAILLGRTKITFQSRLTSNCARRDRKLCPCHWDAGEKCKYPSPERTPHMHPGVPGVAPPAQNVHLVRSAFLIPHSYCLFFFHGSHHVHLARGICCCLASAV